MMLEYLKEALQVHRRNALRAMLTSLGVLIGISSTIVMLALGEGARRQIVQQIEKLGSHVLVITPARSYSHGVSSLRGTIDYGDFEVLRDELSGVSWITPSMYRQLPVSHLGQTIDTRIIGSTPHFYPLNAHSLSVGRFLSDQDVALARRVVVLGSKAAEKLQVNASRIGSRLKLGTLDFEIIGILGEKGATSYFDPDMQLVIPISTTLRRYASDKNLDSITMKVDDPQIFDQVMVDAERILRREKGLLPQHKSGLFIRSRTEFLATMQQTIKSFSLLLAGIAVISLIVGGIGIMNMMLVSISERKREIGIRKAIGAAFSDILTQFLTESIVICLVAGLCGVAFGYAISLVVVSFFEWELIVSSRSIILALTFALGTGMLFGIYPALKAARLPPMVALKDL